MKGFNKETGKPHQTPKSPGRTPKDPSERRVTKTFRILPEVKAIIEAQENPTEWLEQVVLQAAGKKPSMDNEVSKEGADRVSNRTS